MNKLDPKLLFVACCAALMTACSAYPRTEADFGNSVTYMISEQTVVTGPVDANPVETGDGERLNSVLEAYRSDVSRAEQLSQPGVTGFGTGAPQ